MSSQTPSNIFSRISHSRFFSNTVIGAIILGAVVIGIETYPHSSEGFGYVLKTIDRFILFIFAVEALFKIMSHGMRPYRYFFDGWNVFDFSILVLCLIPSGGNYFAVARLARIFRVFRLITAMPRLQMLVGALFKSIPSMGYIGLLLGLVFYIFAVLGVFMFGANDPFHFGNLQSALLTLFSVVTLEGWKDVMEIQMHGCSTTSTEMVKVLCTQSTPAGWLAPAFFILFIVSGTMIVLNLFIGVVVNSMSEAQKEMKGSASGLGVLNEIHQISEKIDDLKAHLEKVEAEISKT